jgi:hypothetical protein
MALQLSAQTPPGTFNTTELIRQVLQAADFPNIDQVMPSPQEAQPGDPMTDLLTVTKGMPIAAFPGQDHEAHIQVKTNFLSDPTTGASTSLKQFAPAIQANIREHTMLRYKTQVEGMVAQNTDPEQYQMAVQQGMQDAIIAEAAAQVTAANQQTTMTGSPEQQLLELEMQKLELEKEKLGLNAAKDAADIAIKTRQLELKDEKQIADAAVDGIKIVSDTAQKEKDRTEQSVQHALDLLSDLAKQGVS